MMKGEIKCLPDLMDISEEIDRHEPASSTYLPRIFGRDPGGGMSVIPVGKKEWCSQESMEIDS